MKELSTKKARNYIPAFSPSNGGLETGKGVRETRLDPNRLRIEKNRVYTGESAILIDDKVYCVKSLDLSDVTQAVSAFLYETDTSKTFDFVKKSRERYNELSGVDEGSNFWEAS